MNKRYLDYNDVEAYVRGIVRDITLGEWKPDYIVGLTRGGLLPANLISQYLNVPMHSLDVSLRDSTSDIAPESNVWMAADAFNGMNILVVDDINDTGATLQWIVKDWQKGCHPGDSKWQKVFEGNVRFAVVVNNEASDFVNITYVGEAINKAEKDEWWVFPWEDWWKAKR